MESCGEKVKERGRGREREGVDGVRGEKWRNVEKRGNKETMKELEQEREIKEYENAARYHTNSKQGVLYFLSDMTRYLTIPFKLIMIGLHVYTLYIWYYQYFSNL